MYSTLESQSRTDARLEASRRSLTINSINALNSQLSLYSNAPRRISPMYITGRRVMP